MFTEWGELNIDHFTGWILLCQASLSSLHKERWAWGEISIWVILGGPEQLVFVDMEPEAMHKTTGAESIQ